MPRLPQRLLKSYPMCSLALVPRKLAQRLALAQPELEPVPVPLSVPLEPQRRFAPVLPEQHVLRPERARRPAFPQVHLAATSAT